MLPNLKKKPNHRKWPLLMIVGILFLALLTLQPLAAQTTQLAEGAHTPNHDGQSPAVSAGALQLAAPPPAATVPPPPLEAKIAPLRAKAQKTGGVPIIIALNIPFQPEGKLASEADAQAQRQAIAASQQTLLNRLAGQKIQNVTSFKYIPFMGMVADDAALAILAQSSEVIGIDEDIPMRPTLAESTNIVGAQDAWAAGYAGAGQTVVILDTGTDNSHSFFSGKIVGEACFSSTLSQVSAQTLCPNGGESQEGSGAAAPCSIDGCDHGTHVAGIAAGRGTNFSGVARDATLIPIQVFSRVNDAQRCGGTAPCVLSYSIDQIEALERVYELRGTYTIASVNMSLGGGEFSSVAECEANQANAATKAAIDTLRTAGIATVISSGNDSYVDAMGAPGCISSAVSVGSTTKSNQISTFSNSASFLSLLAPGSGINSAVPGGGFEPKNGTSMAAPHVAGAWAVLKSKSPQAGVDTLLSALQSTGISITDPRNGITKPLIQVDNALNTLTGGNPTPAPGETVTPRPGQTSTPVPTATPIDPTVILVSQATNGTRGNDASEFPDLSSDGRYAVFQSRATTLVSNDTNGFQDIFIRNNFTRQTSLVSVGGNSTQANGNSSRPSISGDARYVVFTSAATNLVSGDTNFVEDIFLRDLTSGSTSRISLTYAGSQANGPSDLPVISTNGRYIAYVSGATNLVAGDTNSAQDIFVYDRDTRQTTRVSLPHGGGQANGDSFSPSISADGRYVAFGSFASNLVSGDINGASDVFVHDRTTAETRLISISGRGARGNNASYGPSISANGFLVAFTSTATNLVDNDTNAVADIFIHDLIEGSTHRISITHRGEQANGGSADPDISADGRFVVFESLATNMVGGDNNSAQDIFVRDRGTDRTQRISISLGGYPGNRYSFAPAVSPNGGVIAYTSLANNLVPNDINNVVDVFAISFSILPTPTATVTETPTPRGTSTATPTVPPTVTPFVTPLAGIVESAAVATSPTIDGDFADWPYTQSVLITHTLSLRAEGEPAPPSDAMMVFRSVWDGSALYVGFEVTDNEVKDYHGSLPGDDAVEIALDVKADFIGNNADDHAFIFTASGLVYDYGQLVVPPTDPASQIEVATRSNGSTGYQVEARIPWRQFAPPPTSDALINFNLALRDNDGGEEWDRAGNDDSYFVWRGGDMAVPNRQWWALHLTGVVQPTSTPTMTTTPATATPTVTGTPPTATPTPTRTPTVLSRRNPIFLPVILRYHPTYPSQPTLLPIDNSDGDGNYTLIWTTSLYSENYELFESNTPTFENSVLIYSLFAPRHSLTGRAPGVYYYRVRGASTKGYGQWSNVQSVVVVGPPPSTVTPTPTITVTPAPIACDTAQALQNANFEQGTTGWAQSSRSTAPIITRDPQFAYQGDWFAYLGGYNNAQDELSQTIAVPSGTRSARLRFVLGIISEEPANNDNDLWGVQIRDLNNQILETSVVYTNRQQSPNWLQESVTWDRTFDRYAGRTIKITFVSTSNATLRTAFLMDNVQLSFYCDAPTLVAPSTAEQPTTPIQGIPDWRTSALPLGEAAGADTLRHHLQPR